MSASGKLRRSSHDSRESAGLCHSACAQELGVQDSSMILTKLRNSPERILLPVGFSFSALAAGIKASGRPDLALVEIADGASAAALFTTNRVVAAPVEVGRASLAAGAGRVRALIV